MDSTNIERAQDYRRAIHYTTIGLGMQPDCADADGYLVCRVHILDTLAAGYSCAASRAERLVAEQIESIESWRSQS